MEHNALGTRMKAYEAAETERRFMPMLPILARMDGRAFHTFCRGLEKPADPRFHSVMVAVTEDLVRETNALVGYTQSDEITLVMHSDDPKCQVFFDGVIFKMTSVLASVATMSFNSRHYATSLNARVGTGATFDARVWQVPTRTEAANALLWREMDATRNSIQSAGQAVFSHEKMQGLSNKEVQEALFTEHGINWNDHEPWFKRGTWVRRRDVTRRFTREELARLPLLHEARKNPELLVARTLVEPVAMPKFGSVVNREAVIFDGAAPVTEKDTTDGNVFA